ncbi:MAG: diguanylate cyclase [Planctomycetota bacterium]
MAPLQASDANQLPLVRLGIASGLFTALRLRHAPTADHSLRVAVTCSRWAQLTQLGASERDELEVAALLHDIGKIGVPDPVLKKPSALSSDQALAMRQATPFALRILRDCCATPNILRAIEFVHAWFDGSDGKLQGEAIPLASRMIAIADAFDAMTTDRAYRKAFPRERAVSELFEGSGSQFDPTLVAEFAGIQAEGHDFAAASTQHWLAAIAAGSQERHWQMQTASSEGAPVRSVEQSFFETLFASSRDAVIFIAPHLQILRWNPAAEVLTGIAAEQIVDCCWHPKLVGLKHASGILVNEEECPITRAANAHTRLRQPVNITTRLMDVIPIEANLIPVSSEGGDPLGSVLVFQDKSKEHTWQAKIKSLHDQVSRDGLTGVANRKEFDRFLGEAVSKHISRRSACSLIICDIDRFKRINDELGHPAGDAGLVAFANLLTQSCREGDLVARYGGEEFVIVCNDCGAVEAAQLAEKVRVALETTKISELGDRVVTASFGVTELQPGDNAETMLRRADRGLLQAKETGRNKVVELGNGMRAVKGAAKPSSRWWSHWGRGKSSVPKSVEVSLVTNAPMNLVVQKLHGFIADHDAEVLAVEPNHIRLHVTTTRAATRRRRSDRPILFRLEITLSERVLSHRHALTSATAIDVQLAPLRVRDRRQRPDEAAEHLLTSLRSYLVAYPEATSS